MFQKIRSSPQIWQIFQIKIAIFEIHLIFDTKRAQNLNNEKWKKQGQNYTYNYLQRKYCK